MQEERENTSQVRNGRDTGLIVVWDNPSLLHQLMALIGDRTMVKRREVIDQATFYSLTWCHHRPFLTVMPHVPSYRPDERLTMDLPGKHCYPTTER
jgi:hypothetical protein